MYILSNFVYQDKYRESVKYILHFVSFLNLYPQTPGRIFVRRLFCLCRDRRAIKVGKWAGGKRIVETSAVNTGNNFIISSLILATLSLAVPSSLVIFASMMTAGLTSSGMLVFTLN